MVTGDALDHHALSESLVGVDTAYYLIHSMSGGAGSTKRISGQRAPFGQVAREAAVSRIIYLGDWARRKPSCPCTFALGKRQGQALRGAGVPVTEFRAAVIIGLGSISFQMIRYLVERLAVMVCPKWIYSRIQPIAIEDLLEYMVSRSERSAEPRLHH